MFFDGQYLTYDNYRLLGGSLDIMPFNLLEFNARKIIDKRTQRRLLNLKDIPEEVKICIYEMINCLNSYEVKAQSKNIASESIDGYNVSYITSVQMQEVIKSKKQELEDIMRNNLANTTIDNVPVLYLGVC